MKETEKIDDKQKREIDARPPSPFPQRLQKLKDNAKYRRFLDILIQIRVNLPLVEVLQKVPKYAKYLKNIVANKQIHTKI